MAHEVGVQRQETIKRGCLAARALIESGVNDWSPEAITAHLKANEPKRSAAWFRGFLAYLLVCEIATDEEARQVLDALNPGHWVSSGVSNAYFEFVQEFSDSLGAVAVHATGQEEDGTDLESLYEFAAPPDQSTPDQDDPDRAALAKWLTGHFGALSESRAAMLEAFVASLLNPDQRAVAGNWSEALLRSSQALLDRGWRVSIAESIDELASTEIDWTGQSIVLPAPNVEAAQTLLRILGRICLPTERQALPNSELRLDLASELAGSLAGWALGADFTSASMCFARFKLLSSNAEPSVVFHSSFDATIDAAADLLDLLRVDRSALSN